MRSKKWTCVFCRYGCWCYSDTLQPLNHNPTFSMNCQLSTGRSLPCDDHRHLRHQPKNHRLLLLPNRRLYDHMLLLSGLPLSIELLIAHTIQILQNAPNLNMDRQTHNGEEIWANVEKKQMVAVNECSWSNCPIQESLHQAIRSHVTPLRSASLYWAFDWTHHPISSKLAKHSGEEIWANADKVQFGFSVEMNGRSLWNCPIQESLCYPGRRLYDP